MSDKVVPFDTVPPAVKEGAISKIDEMKEDTALKLIAQLKVILLADADAPLEGGLNERNRKRAWKMVAELGMMMLKGREQ